MYKHIYIYICVHKKCASHINLTEWSDNDKHDKNIINNNDKK